MAFRNKAHLLEQYDADILIIPECEHPEKLISSSATKQPNDILWFGSNINKGLAVLSFNNYRIKLLDIHNKDITIVLPIGVTGGEYDFTMLAIWAGKGYIRQVWNAIKFYDKLISDKNTLLIGDFNSNSIWDYKHGKNNHSSMAVELQKKKITSTYHHYYNLSQGKEKHPTFSLFRHKDKPYHIDYCFASSDLIKNLTKVEVGSHDEWSKYSDHSPLVIDFNSLSSSL